MRRKLLSILVAFFVLNATTASATTIIVPPAHDRKAACSNVMSLVDDWNKGRHFKSNYFSSRTYVTDKFGEVEHSERSDFVRWMQESEGKPDKGPTKVSSLRRLSKDKLRPHYILSTERQVWREKRWVPSGGDPLLEEGKFVDDGHWETQWTSWLVTFYGNDVEVIREVADLYLIDKVGKQVRGCSNS